MPESLKKALEIELCLSNDAETKLDIPLFNDAYQIISVSHEADAAVTLSEDACLNVGDQVYVFGTTTCPEPNLTPYTITSRIDSKTYRMGLDSNLQGSQEELGVLGVVDNDPERIVSAKLYDTEFDKKNFFVSDDVERLENDLVLVDAANVGAEILSVNGLEYPIEGITKGGNGCNPEFFIKIAGNLPESFTAVCGWSLQQTTRKAASSIPLGVVKTADFLYQVRIPAYQDTTKILELIRYPGGVVQDWLIRAVLKFGG